MALQCGIVGLPNVGKSTLFNCLSNAKAQAANFPFCTIEPNVGVITVPDERLNKLAELVIPDRIVPTTVEIVDIAGLVKGASKGEGLGNKFLANIRETDAILHVLRCFDDENVTHVDGSVDPVRDKEIIDTELQLKDLETIESRIQKVQKQAQTGGDKVAKQTYEVLVRYREALLQGKSARTVQFETKDEQKIAHELFLLTSKPVMYVCNVDEASAANGNKYVEQVREAVKEEGAEILIVAAKTEADIAGTKQYHSTQAFETGKWYHVAFTYDQPSGKTVLYINGSKAAESTWDTPSFDLASEGSGGFFIGKVAGFMWGERPFYGYMSEVRLWNVARTENQIKQNMLNVDPNSDGLAAYYKLNGTDQFESGGTCYVKDASPNGMDGLANGGGSALNIIDLETPIAIK